MSQVNSQPHLAPLRDVPNLLVSDVSYQAMNSARPGGAPANQYLVDPSLTEPQRREESSPYQRG